uniref:DM5 domain-containing protein n=1 Tax=Anopheles funestus TaxID=62324 RepID=A0A182RH98_ANOFN
MKVLVVLACVAIVVARPEPPVGGYHQHHGGHGGHGGQGGYNYAQPAPHSPAPAFGHSAQFSGSAATASTGGAFLDTLSAGGASSAFSGASSGAFSGASSGAFSGSSANAFSNANSFSQSNVGAFVAPQQQIVQKHIYVHVPPPEPEQSFQQQIVAPGLRQKHYKIIFIKTPHVQPSAAQLALQQSQTEEKTIVYVLVKKPEALGNINLPAPSVTKPSKPEVYFIKYKTNTEAVQAPVGVGVSSSGSAQADAGGLGILSSSGAASASASAGAHSSVSNVPAQAYGAPGHHHGGGYH